MAITPWNELVMKAQFDIPEAIEVEEFTDVTTGNTIYSYTRREADGSITAWKDTVTRQNLQTYEPPNFNLPPQPAANPHDMKMVATPKMMPDEEKLLKDEIALLREQLAAAEEQLELANQEADEFTQQKRYMIAFLDDLDRTKSAYDAPMQQLITNWVAQLRAAIK